MEALVGCRRLGDDPHCAPPDLLVHLEKDHRVAADAPPPGRRRRHSSFHACNDPLHLPNIADGHSDYQSSLCAFPAGDLDGDPVW